MQLSTEPYDQGSSAGPKAILIEDVPEFAEWGPIRSKACAVHHRSANMSKVTAPDASLTWTEEGHRNSDSVSYEAKTNEGRWLVLPSRAGAEAHFVFNGFSIGYADTQGDAAALIDILQTGAADGNLLDILAEAGFKNSSDARSFKKTVAGQSFDLHVSPGEILLTFAKKNWDHWENLAYFEINDSAAEIPNSPPSMPARLASNFEMLSDRACIAMADRYIADGRNKRRYKAPETR
jgi:hypothetical protein